MKEANRLRVPLARQLIEFRRPVRHIKHGPNRRWHPPDGVPIGVNEHVLRQDLSIELALKCLHEFVDELHRERLARTKPGRHPRPSLRHGW
jgi:hypothetical protein